jgi:hypothetical protein
MASDVVLGQRRIATVLLGHLAAWHFGVQLVGRR